MSSGKKGIQDWGFSVGRGGLEVENDITVTRMEMYYGRGRGGSRNGVRVIRMEMGSRI